MGDDQGGAGLAGERGTGEGGLWRRRRGEGGAAGCGCGGGVGEGVGVWLGGCCHGVLDCCGREGEGEGGGGDGYMGVGVVAVETGLRSAMAEG